MTDDVLKQADKYYEVFGIPAWINFIPALVELQIVGASSTICAAQAHLFGFKAGVMSVLETVNGSTSSPRAGSPYRTVERGYLHETN